MTTLFTLLSFAVIFYRFRKRLLTKAEIVLLLIWAGHFILEELQVIAAHSGRFYYDARYLRPAEFLLWGELAWAIVRVREIFPSLAAVRLRLFFSFSFSLLLLYDVVMLVKPRLPVGRRGAYVAACKWAAEKIRADYQGPEKDSEFVFSLERYRVPNRPVIDCYSARLPYLVGGRSNGNDEDENTARLDRADYWVQDLRTDDPPDEDWELIDTFKRGEYELPLYRRKK